MSDNVIQFPGDTAEDWAALETHVTADGKFAPPVKQQTGPHAKVQKFPCVNCGGSGQYRHFGKCFACKGQGYFLTSEADRRAAKVKRQADKVKTLHDARVVWDAQNPGLGEWLQGAASWSGFAGEMVHALAQYGALTDGQTAGSIRMRSKCEQRREERAAEKVAGNATVDLEPIRRMFENAVTNGFKKPVYRAAGLQISRAPDHGRNPGALYVVAIENDDYLGKILGIQYTGKPAPGLAVIAADPRGEAVRYGQQEGRCSCCGARLTRKESIARGIGPICAEKWGI